MGSYLPPLVRNGTTKCVIRLKVVKLSMTIYMIYSVSKKKRSFYTYPAFKASLDKNQRNLFELFLIGKSLCF